jgi:hypothetical protein
MVLRASNPKTVWERGGSGHVAEMGQFEDYLT